MPYMFKNPTVWKLEAYGWIQIAKCLQNKAMNKKKAGRRWEEILLLEFNFFKVCASSHSILIVTIRDK